MSTDAVNAALPVLPVAIPLTAAAVTVLLRRYALLQRSVMEAGVALAVACAVALLVRGAQGAPPVTSFGGWPAPFGITFVGDILSAALVVTACVIALAVAAFARADIRDRRRHAGFDPLFLAMLAAVNGALLTGDIFNLYVWFELMLVTALGLITLDRRRAQIDGAIRYAAMSMMGATFILIGIALLYGETGTLDIRELGLMLAGRAPSVALTASAYLIVSGLVLKAGVFPLFFWLPASYHTAPISVTAALAGWMTKVAFYACLRVLTVVFGVGATSGPVRGLSALLAILSALTMLISVFAAIAQFDIRRLLAFHVLAQVAYLVMGLALAASAGAAAAIFYTMHTMLVQTGLFLGAGAIARSGRSYDLRVVSGLMREQPFFSTLFAMLALSISGVPPLSGFWAKALVLDAAFRVPSLWSMALAVVALLTGLLTLYSMSTFWSRAFWRPPRSGATIRPIPPAMVVSVGLLAACTLGIGIAVEPVLRLARAAASQLAGGPP